MNPYLPDAWTRRAFLMRGVALASAAATVPSFLERSAYAMAQGAADLRSRPGVPDERILVVVQLSGGNDGLNTVVPFRDPVYHRSRPVIAIPEREVIRLNDAVGFHPSMTGLKSLHDDGLLSVVQGVGYPNPNRSHFVSMDIWHTADTRAAGAGWLGRYIDNECAGARPRATPCEPTPAISLGREAPLALLGRTSQPVSIESPEHYRWTGDALNALAPSAPATPGAPGGANTPPNPVLDFLTRTSLDAQVSSDTIRKAAGAAPMTAWPRNALSQQLQLVCAMIRAGMPTRVYYTSLGGFDTHAQQGGAQGRHAQLLTQLSESLRAFYNELKAQRDDARVLTLCFSEFGRRVSQNASNGTDHGAAAPVFLAGPMVRPGVLNTHPSMNDLEDGDLRFNIDFRSIYTGVLQDWLRADARAVLGGSFRKAELFRRA